MKITHALREFNAKTYSLWCIYSGYTHYNSLYIVSCWGKYVTIFPHVVKGLFL